MVNLVVEVAVDDSGKNVGQLAKRLDIVQLARLNQRSDGDLLLGAAVRAREEGIPTVERDRADRTLGGIASDLDEPSSRKRVSPS